MSGTFVRTVNDPCLDRAALEARPAGDLWGMLLKVAQALAARAAAPVREWRSRVRTRLLLSRLTPHQLEDIGLTVQDAQWEVNKPFWKA